MSLKIICLRIKKYVYLLLSLKNHYEKNAVKHPLR
jgi:hypothetical protein